MKKTTHKRFFVILNVQQCIRLSIVFINRNRFRTATPAKMSTTYIFRTQSNILISLTIIVIWEFFKTIIKVLSISLKQYFFNLPHCTPRRNSTCKTKESYKATFLMIVSLKLKIYIKIIIGEISYAILAHNSD